MASPASKGKSHTINGFHFVEEIPALEVADANISPYSLASECLSWDPPRDTVITPFKNGDSERKIHCNIELEDKELEDLKALQKEAKAQGKAFVPSITVMATRYLSRARADPKKALKLMQATQEWRETFFKNGPVADTQVAEDLKHGICYWSGRDKNLRPVFVIRPSRIPNEWYKTKQLDRFIKVIIFCMEYFLRYMCIPGKVENNCLIVDLKGVGISQMPVGALTEVYKVTSHHYIGRVFRFYVVNLSGMLRTLSGAVSGLLTDRQKQKLCILDNVAELSKDVAGHQLEADLGGNRQPISTYFPFPMPPGPFDIGSTSNADSIQNVHRVLTPMGCRGKLWDVKKTAEQNKQLDYTAEAFDVFTRYDMPIPPNCPRPAAEVPAAAPAEAAAESRLVTPAAEVAGAEAPEAKDGVAPGDVADPAAIGLPLATDGVSVMAAAETKEYDSEPEESEQEVTIEQATIKPSGFWSCLCKKE